MSDLILFWLREQPDDNMDGIQWEAFQQNLGYLVVLAALVCASAIWVFYRRAAAQNLVRSEDDIFGPYRPIWWITLSIAPGLALWLGAWYLFAQQFPDSQVNFIGHALTVGLFTVFVTAVLSMVVIPFLTPDKFKYRIWRPF